MQDNILVSFVTQHSTCILSDIEIWVSGRLQEVKNNRRNKINSVDSGHVLLGEVVLYKWI